MNSIDNLTGVLKSLDVGPSEQSICFANFESSMKVICMQASDGTVTSAIKQ